MIPTSRVASASISSAREEPRISFSNALSATRPVGPGSGLLGNSRSAALDRDLLPWLAVLAACAVAFALRDELPWLKALPADLLPPAPEVHDRLDGVHVLMLGAAPARTTGGKEGSHE